MNDAIPDAARREILRLDMHDVQVAEIVRQTGVKRSTVSTIITHTRGWLKEQWRGDIVLLCDPAGIFTPGARFNHSDLRAMVRLSGLVDGVAFKITRRDGSIYRASMQGGKLIRMRGFLFAPIMEVSDGIESDRSARARFKSVALGGL